MMSRRQKIIAEMVQTEKDYLNDLDLCIRMVVDPLRRRQVRTSSVEVLGFLQEPIQFILPESLCPTTLRSTAVPPQRAPAHKPGGSQFKFDLSLTVA